MRNVRMNSASRMAVPNASTYSRIVERTLLGCETASVARLGAESEDDFLLTDFENGQKGLLGNFDVADLLHALLSFLLLLEQLALARDVAAVALGRHVLANGLDGF